MPGSKLHPHDAPISKPVALRQEQDAFVPLLSIVALDGQTFALGKATQSQAKDIAIMINYSATHGGEVIPVTEDEIKCWISKGLDYVVMDGNKIIAHIAVDIWPKGAEQPTSFEIRSVVVNEDYRGIRIHEQMSKFVISTLHTEYEDVPIIEVKKGAQGLHLLENIGFEHYELKKAQKFGLDVVGLDEVQWKVYVYGLAERYETPTNTFEDPIEKDSKLLRN